MSSHLGVRSCCLHRQAMKEISAAVTATSTPICRGTSRPVRKAAKKPLRVGICFQALMEM